MRLSSHIFILTGIIALFSSLAGCAEEASPVQGPRLPAPQLKGMSYEQYGIPLKDLRIRQGRFAKGEYLRDVLEAKGITRTKVDEVTAAAEGVFDFTRIREGNAYTLLWKPDGALAYFIYDITESDYVVINLGDEVEVHTGKKAVEIQWQSVGVKIESSLYEAIANKGLDVRLVGMMEQAFGWSADFSDLEAGDEIAIIYERPLIEGSLGDISGIVAALIRHKSLERFAIFFQPDTIGSYYLPSGRNLHPGFLLVPLAGSDSDEIGVQTGAYQSSLIGPGGTPVIAIADGKVTRAIYTRRDGYHVHMEHGSYRSHYTQLDSLNPALKARGWQLQGDTLGWLAEPQAKAGKLTLFKGRQTVDQRQPLPLPGADVAPGDQKRFGTQRDHLMRQLRRIQPNGAPKKVALQP